MSHRSHLDRPDPSPTRRRLMMAAGLGARRGLVGLSPGRVRQRQRPALRAGDPARRHGRPVGRAGDRRPGLRRRPRSARRLRDDGAALEGPFALHPELGQLHAMYGRGELAVVHGVGLAYRNRSHFDAQQVLESGGTRPFEIATGWLGRALPTATPRPSP